jgi:hypothetical protein
VHTKKFQCSTGFVKGLCKISSKIKLQDKLPDGVVSLKRWPHTDVVEILFFNGYWMADSLHNMLLLNGLYRTIKCYVPGKNNISANELKCRNELLHTYSNYSNRISAYFKTSKTPKSTVRPDDKKKSEPCLEEKASEPSKEKVSKPVEELSTSSVNKPVEELSTSSVNNPENNLYLDKRFSLIENRLHLVELKLTEFQIISQKFPHLEHSLLTLEQKIQCYEAVLNQVISSVQTVESQVSQTTEKIPAFEFALNYILSYLGKKDPTFAEDNDCAVSGHSQNVGGHSQNDVPQDKHNPSFGHENQMKTGFEHSCLASSAPINDVVQQFSKDEILSKDEIPKREITQKVSRTLELVEFLWVHLLKNKTFSLDDSHKIQLNEILQKFSLTNSPTTLTKVVNSLKKRFENYNQVEISLQILFLFYDCLFKIDSPWKLLFESRRNSVNDDIQKQFKPSHSTSLVKSQPFSIDEDGPLENLRISNDRIANRFDTESYFSLLNLEEIQQFQSYHSTSLYNSQPFCIDEDGPPQKLHKDKIAEEKIDQNSEQKIDANSVQILFDEKEDVLCPFQNCSNRSNRRYKGYEALRSHLNSKHLNELNQLPKSLLQKFLRLSNPRAYCNQCHFLQPYATLHSCVPGHKIRLKNSSQYNQRSISDMESNDSSFSNVHDVESHISTLRVFQTFSWEKIATIPASLMKDIPYNFRLAMNECWCYVLSLIIDDSFNECAWKLLFLLPSLLLRTVPKKFLNSSTSLNSILKIRFQNFKERQFAPLIKDLLHESEDFVSQQYDNGGKSSSSNYSRIKWLAAEGSPSKALSTLNSSHVAKVDERSFSLMKEKHPDCDEKFMENDSPNHTDECKLDFFPTSICLSALKSFDRTTAAGPSGIRVSYILDCITIEHGDNPKILDLFSKVLTLLALGNAPESISSFVSGARLVALEKPKLHKDGFPDLRPIAVGELLRRWVGKILISLHRSQITEYFHPLQLGVGTKCGSEIIHKAVLSKMKSNPNLVLFQVDLTNAFNLCSRSFFLKQLNMFPKIYSWTKWVYGSQPWLFFGDYVLRSAQGVQQGDPLGPFLFALTLHPILLKIQSLLRSCLHKDDFINLWYLDDGNLVVPLHLVPKVLQILNSPEALSAGLYLNLAKSTVFSYNWDTVLKSSDITTFTQNGVEWLKFPDFEIPIERNGVRLLGFPLGSDEFICSFITQRIKELEILVSKLLELPDLHISFYLWKFCAGFCKVSALMRCLPPKFNIVDPYREVCIAMFSHLFGGHYMSDLHLWQTAISPSLGGFGLRFFEEYHYSAYLASSMQCLSFLTDILSTDEIAILKNEIDENYNHVLKFCLPGALPDLHAVSKLPKIQSFLSNLVDNCKLDSFLKSESLSLREKARLQGCSTQYASAWMMCAPNPKKGNFLDNQSFTLLLKYWLGIPIFSTNSKCRLCGSTLDIFGDHALHCKKKGNIVRRHDHVRDVLFNFLNIASIQAKKEIVGYLAGEKSRVGDIVLPFGGSGLQTNTECLYDVTIFSSLYIDRINNSSMEKESTAELAVRSKLTKRKADGLGLIDTSKGKRKFIPLGFEALGGFSFNSKKFVDYIAMEWSSKSGVDKSIAKAAIVSKVSMAIQRGNGMCLATVSAACLTRDIDEICCQYPLL